MKMVLLTGLLLMGGCASVAQRMGTKSCMQPTPREAKITKRVWE